MRKIKLIWDFRGPEAEGTAKHHAIHLEEYKVKEQIETFQIGHEVLSEMHTIAFMAVNEKDMIVVRDTLRPHRGEVFEG